MLLSSGEKATITKQVHSGVNPEDVHLQKHPEHDKAAQEYAKEVGGHGRLLPAPRFQAIPTREHWSCGPRANCQSPLCQSPLTPTWVCIIANALQVAAREAEEPHGKGQHHAIHARGELRHAPYDWLAAHRPSGLARIIACLSKVQAV
jgi:hypothetical protein